MHLVQLLLPVRDNAGNPFPRALFEDVQRALTARFGGVTAYARAPAEGTFASGSEGVVVDDIVVVEVMVQSIDRAFWTQYVHQLAEAFAQDDLVVRALAMERL
jgi:hypothetical protein